MPQPLTIVTTPLYPGAQAGEPSALRLQAVADGRTLAQAQITTLSPRQHRVTVRNHPISWTHDLTPTFTDTEAALEFARQALTDIVGPVPAARGGPAGHDWTHSIAPDQPPRE